MSDLANFRPNSAKDLLDEILAQLQSVLLDRFASFKKEMSVHLQSLAKKAWLTKVGLQNGTISQADADIGLHTQELAFNNIVLYSELLAYELAQAVLDTVFGVIVAAIKNLTGVELNF